MFYLKQQNRKTNIFVGKKEYLFKNAETMSLNSKGIETNGIGLPEEVNFLKNFF